MRKLLVVVPVLLALVLTLVACGGGDSSESTQPEIRPPAKVRPADAPFSNVEGEWERWNGATFEHFLAITANKKHRYAGARFITNDAGLRLKMDSKSTVVEASSCYTGVDLFCERWDGKSLLPFVKTITIKGEDYEVRLVDAWVRICDPDLKPDQPKQAAHGANQT